MLGERLREAAHFADVDLIVPVPLHWTRRFRRGYNQAEVLARGIAGVLGATVAPAALKRQRRTKTQTRLSIEEKARNVASAFRAAPPRPGVRHILLIDDVLTTGATLTASFLALRSVYPLPVRISVATLSAVL